MMVVMSLKVCAMNGNVVSMSLPAVKMGHVCQAFCNAMEFNTAAIKRTKPIVQTHVKIMNSTALGNTNAFQRLSFVMEKLTVQVS